MRDDSAEIAEALTNIPTAENTELYQRICLLTLKQV